MMMGAYQHASTAGPAAAVTFLVGSANSIPRHLVLPDGHLSATAAAACRGGGNDDAQHVLCPQRAHAAVDPSIMEQPASIIIYQQTPFTVTTWKHVLLANNTPRRQAHAGPQAAARETSKSRLASATAEHAGSAAFTAKRVRRPVHRCAPAWRHPTACCACT